MNHNKPTEVVAGKYEILRELGEGATGKVYLVRHIDIGAEYALKILSRTLSEDSRFLERFKREAQALLKFFHPGSVQLRDFGRTEDGLYYLAMDYCGGMSLKNILDNYGALGSERGLGIMTQILGVLGAAHEHGIVHRDIKPENIMIEEVAGGREVVKVLDFGIAKLKYLDTHQNQRSTIDGVAVGTPYYMSPEQAAGDTGLDHRVDLYACGVVLYEMISGAVPFEGESVVQTLLMHLTKPPEAFDTALGVSDAVQSIIFQSLQKNRDNRYQSAADFKRDCDRALHQLKQNNPCAQNHLEEGFEAGSYQSLVAVAPEARGKKVLVLDDSEMVLNILKLLLEREVIEVLTASTFSVIHSMIFTKGVDLLVSDVTMPDVPGNKVCQMLKQVMPELKILLFSNLPDRELEKLATDSNADGWISKNTKPDHWLQKIKLVL